MRSDRLEMLPTNWSFANHIHNIMYKLDLSLNNHKTQPTNEKSWIRPKIPTIVNPSIPSQLLDKVSIFITFLYSLSGSSITQ